MIHLNYSQSDTSKPPGQPETLPSGGYTATLPGNGHTATLPGNSHGSRKPLPNVQTGEHLDAEKSVVVSSNQRNGSNIQNSTRYLGNYYFNH